MVQSPNASSSMKATWGGIVMLDNAVQKEKVQKLMVVRLSGRLTLVKLLHSSNTDSFRVVMP